MNEKIKAVWCERLKKFITYSDGPVSRYATKRTQCSSYNTDIEQETRSIEPDRFCNFRKCFGDGKECLGIEGTFVPDTPTQVGMKEEELKRCINKEEINE